MASRLRGGSNGDPGCRVCVNELVVSCTAYLSLPVVPFLDFLPLTSSSLSSTLRVFGPALVSRSTSCINLSHLPLTSLHPLLHCVFSSLPGLFVSSKATPLVPPAFPRLSRRCELAYFLLM